VLRNFTKDIGRGDRIGIVGPNGTGKTTLLNMLAGRLTPDAGTLVRGETVRLAYYDQESSDLDERLRVIDYLTEAASLIQTNDGAVVTAQTMLERFLFPAAAQYARIGSLSGGERRRLYLLRTLVFGPNVLLLDEPTNDLDIQTLSVLEDYLDGFDGTLVVASHDRYFLDRTIEQILGFEGEGVVREYAGGYSEYAQERARRHTTAAQQERAAKPRVVEAQSTSKRSRTLSFKEKRELGEVEQRIANLEAEQKRLESMLAAGSGDYAALQQAAERLAGIGAEIESAFERWAELSAIAEGVV
jgi:ATP-binding cassette subfamily F protein uup